MRQRGTRRGLSREVRKAEASLESIWMVRSRKALAKDELALSSWK